MYNSGTAMKLLFKKYLHSVLDPDEFSVLENYLTSRKNEKEISGLMKTHWDETMGGTFEGSKPDPALFKQIKGAMEVDRHKRARRKLKLYTWGMRAAAVLVLALISGGIFYMRSKQELLARQWHTITTPFGAKTKITLPDSSTIWLNAGSSLKYSSEFGNRNREVHLSGEAFFDVFQNPSLLFMVQTSELTIKSYGTAFNVKSYPDEGTIETTLIEGSIGITRSSIGDKKKDEVLLEPNQRVVYYRNTRTMESAQASRNTADAPAPSIPEPKEQKTTYLISKGIDTQEYTSWKDGTIYISSETLKELAIKLERKYNVSIHFEDETLKSLRFTGSLENETVEQVIHAIGMSAQIDYEIEDRDIWFKEQSK
jgi:ferric-dicitrate binding protein FerR (iron transport regulator)